MGFSRHSVAWRWPLGKPWVTWRWAYPVMEVSVWAHHHQICVAFPQAESSQRRPFRLLLSVGKARINDLHKSQVSGGPRACTIHLVWLGAHTRNSRVVWLVRSSCFLTFFLPLTWSQDLCYQDVIVTIWLVLSVFNIYPTEPTSRHHPCPHTMAAPMATIRTCVFTMFPTCPDSPLVRIPFSMIRTWNINSFIGNGDTDSYTRFLGFGSCDAGIF